MMIFILRFFQKKNQPIFISNINLLAFSKQPFCFVSQSKSIQLQIKMQANHLQWIQQQFRKKILTHPDIANYSLDKQKKEVFIPRLKILQVDGPNFIRKQYLGYGVETALPQRLHPILGIYVRLQLTNYQLLYRLRNVIEFHINYPSQCIQKIYEVKRLSFSQERYSGLLLNCELYKFTLQDLFVAIKDKRISGFPKKFFVFARAFLLQAYLNILYLLDHPQTASLCLAFTINPRNIYIDQFYRLMLGNPFFAKDPPSPLLAFENQRNERYMHDGILKEFYIVFQQIIELGDQVQILQPQKITMRVFGRKPSQFLKVKDQIQEIQSIMKMHNLYFEFPNEELINYFKNAEKALGEGANPYPLAKFNLEKGERTKQYLRKKVQQYDI